MSENNGQIMGNMATLVYLGVANGMISLLIAKSKFFEKFRDYFFNRGHSFIHELLSCPYCISHWVAIMMTIIWQPRLTNSIIPLDFLISMFVMVAVATVSWTIAFGLMNWAEKE